MEKETLDNKLNKILEYEKRLKNGISSVKIKKSKFPHIKTLSNDTDSVVSKINYKTHINKLPLLSERS